MKYLFSTAMLALTFGMNTQAQSQFNLSKVQMLEDIALTCIRIEASLPHLAEPVFVLTSQRAACATIANHSTPPNVSYQTLCQQRLKSRNA